MPARDRHPRPDSLIAALPGDLVPYQSFAAARSIPPEQWVPFTHQRQELVRAAERVDSPPIAEASYHDLLVWNDGYNAKVLRVGGIIAIHLRLDEPIIRLVVLPGAAFTPSVIERVLELATAFEVRYLTSSALEALAPVLATGRVTAVAPLADPDYVYPMVGLATMAGRGRRKARREANAFATAYEGRLEIREGLLSERWAQRFLLEVHHRWVVTKFGSPLYLPAELRREWKGVINTPTDERAAVLRVFALSVDETPVAISVIEPMSPLLWMGTVMKSDRKNYLSSTAFLRRHVSRTGLSELGPGGLLSLMQDDGDLNLRASKRSYRPAFMEPKYALLPVAPDHPIYPGSTTNNNQEH